MRGFIQLLLLVLTFISISTAAQQVFYVLADNSTNVSCSFQPCATLSQYLLDNNGSLPVLSDVKYHFSPGEHQIPTSITLQYLHNFVITGISGNKSLSTILIIGLHIKVRNSTNFTISNVVVKTYYDQHYDDSNDAICKVVLTNCIFCNITNVFLNTGLCGESLGGKSYVSE